MKPLRIQRRRVKGWKAPENTVNCTRPGKWGNPFKVQYGAICILHKRGHLPLYILKPDDNAQQLLVNCYKQFIDGERHFFGILLPDWSDFIPVSKLEIKELKGRNLMCFCAEGTPCHADLLLQEANQ